MKHRLVTLALGVGVALTLAAPATPAAHAMACNRQAFPEFCAVYDIVCARTGVCRLFG
jgi:hypothetical protein